MEHTETEVNRQVTSEEQPAQTPEVETSDTSLPSVEEERQKADNALEDNFKITDKIKEQYLKGDKLLGKYDSLEQLIEAHKHIQDKHSQFVDEVKTKEKEITSDVEKRAAEVKKAEALSSVAMQVLSSNMEITDEIKAAIEEAGVSEAEVKLAAYEAKEALQKQYELVGGEEVYKSLMEYGASIYDQRQQEEIRNAIQSGIVPKEVRELAILGLKYKKEVLNQQSQASEGSKERIVGEPAEVSIKPYTDKRELFRDKRYIDSPAGRRDKNAQRIYRQRLAVTPPEVYRGY